MKASELQDMFLCSLFDPLRIVVNGCTNDAQNFRAMDAVNLSPGGLSESGAVTSWDRYAHSHDLANDDSDTCPTHGDPDADHNSYPNDHFHTGAMGLPATTR